MPLSGYNAEVWYEASQTARGNNILYDSGDHLKYTSDSGGADEKWSDFEDVKNGITAGATVLANGVVEGCDVVPDPDTNNQVIIRAGSINLNGVVVTVAQQTLAMTRPATTTYRTSSVTINSSGTAVEAAGTDDASAYSDTRAATGGPPLIATAVAEIAQVRLYDDAAAIILTSEILKQNNVHRESAYDPPLRLDYITGNATFSSALMVNHVGSITKAVYADTFAPDFTKLYNVSNASVPTVTHSASEEQVYEDVVTSISSGKDQGGFTIMSEGDVNEAMEKLDNLRAWFRVKPARTKAKAYSGIAISSRKVEIPPDATVKATVTLTGITNFITESV
jgi:hypothetical protein